MGKDQMARDTAAPIGQQALDASPPARTPLALHGHEHAPAAALTRATSRIGSSPRSNCTSASRCRWPASCSPWSAFRSASPRARAASRAGYVNAIFLAFFCYYLSFVSLVGLARQKDAARARGDLAAQRVFFVAGLIFLHRMEQPGDRDLFGDLRAWLGRLLQSIETRVTGKDRHAVSPDGGCPCCRSWWTPTSFRTFFYLVLVLASFVSLTQVYNFFELIGDMLRNNISLLTMFTYLFFLIPQLVYDLLPISVLVAVLVTFGVMSKQNEVTAFKACGVSLFRLAAPVLLVSTLFSGGLFAFDFYYVPGANRKQDALRDEIKGRATQTYLRPDRKWIMGITPRASTITSTSITPAKRAR